MDYLNNGLSVSYVKDSCRNLACRSGSLTWSDPECHVLYTHLGKQVGFSCSALKRTHCLHVCISHICEWLPSIVLALKQIKHSWMDITVKHNKHHFPIVIRWKTGYNPIFIKRSGPPSWADNIATCIGNHLNRATLKIDKMRNTSTYTVYSHQTHFTNELSTVDIQRIIMENIFVSMVFIF